MLRRAAAIRPGSSDGLMIFMSSLIGLAIRQAPPPKAEASASEMKLQVTASLSPRAAAMFAEVERVEAIHRRQQAVEQGVQQVEAFIGQGDSAKAELALRILVQMDPENRHRKRLEKAVGGMKR